MVSFVHFLNQKDAKSWLEDFKQFISHPVEVNWLELWGLQMQIWKRSWLQKENSTLFHLCPWRLLHQHHYPHHHHHCHHYNLHWQVQTGRRCSNSSDSGRTRRGRSLWWLTAEPGRKNQNMIKNKELTLNNCWTSIFTISKYLREQKGFVVRGQLEHWQQSFGIRQWHWTV